MKNPAHSSNSAPRRPPRDVLLALEQYDHRIHQGIARYARDHGWRLDSSMTHSHQIDPDWSGDGVLCRGSELDELVALTQKHPMPVVSVGSAPPKPGLKGAVDIELDLNALFSMTIEDFIASGYTHIALAGNLTQTRTRQFGSVSDVFERIATQHGVDSTCLPHPPSPAAARTTYPAMLAHCATPVAILASDDLCAVDILNACNTAGLRVPDDVAILGLHNSPGIWDSTHPSLSSVDTNFESWGYEAAALLDTLLDGAAAPTPYPLHTPKQIVTRRSTNFIAVQNEIAANAMLFIRERANNGITVADVVAHSIVSRQHLDLLFKKHLGWSVSSELERVRVTRVQNLLISTNASVAEIAEQAGYANALNLHRSFKRRFGIAPGQFRKANSSEGT